jgi:hypothetical protein
MLIKYWDHRSSMGHMALFLISAKPLTDAKSRDGIKAFRFMHAMHL